MTAPDRIFAFDHDDQAADGSWITRKSWSDQSIAPMASVEYVRADLARAPAEALAVPEVAALRSALMWAYDRFMTDNLTDRERNATGAEIIKVLLGQASVAAQFRPTETYQSPALKALKRGGAAHD